MSLDVTIGDAVIRSAPIVGAAGAEAVSRYLGLTLHEWFYVATIAYTFVQVWAVIYKTLKGGDNES
ncbi:MAG: hypothetical protein ACRCYZ_06465 [Alphaproteobacteria bacterium]|uniref:Holin n=1 Tax=Aeromonas phage phiA014S TaxID=3119845 RepID=A0ABZ2CQX3_9CAUD